MRFSVICAVNNYPALLEELLVSLVAQDHQNFETIIVIDGFPEAPVFQELLTVLRKFESKIELKKIINGTDLGLTKSLNCALKYATGEIVVRVDADDLCKPNRLSSLVKYFNDGYQFVGNVCDLIDFNGQALRNYPKVLLKRDDCLAKLMKLQRVVPHSGFAFSTELAKMVDGYNNYYVFAQDYDLLLRMINILSMDQFLIIPEALSTVRLHQKSISQSSNREAQFTFQLVALISYKLRTKGYFFSSNEELDEIAHLVKTHARWKQIRVSQISKASVRDLSRMSVFFFLICKPLTLYCILKERKFALQIVSEVEAFLKMSKCGQPS